MQQVKSILSIIVPVYNAQSYIERCVESILSQDYSSYELLLVDDGSSDSSLEICEALQEKDERIKVIHQTNFGVNAARLRGFRKSVGEYVMFVDADDMLPSTAISSLMTIINDYDVVRGGHYVFDDIHQISYDILNRDKVFPKGEDFAVALHKGEVEPYLWGGIYKKEIIEESFFEKLIDYNITIGEDFLMNLFISRNVKRVKIISQIVYLYYKNVSSVMHTKIMGREYANRVDMCISDYVASASEEVKQLFVLNQVKGIISRDFQKEIAFSIEDYHFVMDYIKDKDNSKGLYTSLPIKYLWCIRYLPIYYIYSRCFSYYRWIKRGMRNRRVIV